MKGIFVVVVTLVIAGSVSSLKYDDICQTKHKGNSMRNPDDCSRYFLCDGDKVKERRACWDDTLWDTDSESCQPPDDVTCENKPTTTNDPCPGTTGIIRYRYPGYPKRYLLCKNGKSRGNRRDARSGGVTYQDQKYFTGCPKKGRYFVLYEEHPTFYFICLKGKHVKTKVINDKVRDKVMKPKDLPKEGVSMDEEEEKKDKKKEEDKKDAKKENDKNQKIKDKKDKKQAKLDEKKKKLDAKKADRDAKKRPMKRFVNSDETEESNSKEKANSQSVSAE